MKIIMLILSGLIFISNLFGQKNYAEINFGYGIKTNTQFKYNTFDDGFNYETESTTYSFGEGISFDLAIGRRITNIISVQLSFLYHQGKDQDLSKVIAPNWYYHRQLEPGMISVMPAVNFREEFGDFSPFLEIGVSINKLDLNETITDFQDFDSTIYKYEYEGDWQWGFTSSLGILYSLSDYIKLRFSMQYHLINFFPGTRTMTEAISGGINIIDSIPEYSKNTIYEDKVIYSDFNENEPTKRTLILFPFSSISLKLGLQYYF